MSTIIDALVLVLVLLPAIVLVALIIQSAMPWLSRSWREAELRADNLIRSLLSQEEYDKLKRDGFLDIQSPNFPNRIYRIPSGVGTVIVMESGQCIARLCVYSTQPIPEREAVLIHKLMIEGNELEYLRTANHLPC